MRETETETRDKVEEPNIKVKLGRQLLRQPNPNETVQRKFEALLQT
jgi:hypothetical protein